MNPTTLAASLALALVLLGPAAAATPVPTCETKARAGANVPGSSTGALAAAVAACTRIASPPKRLDCYDALTGHTD